MVWCLVLALLKCIDERDAAHAPLTKALEAVSKIASDINASVHTREAQLRVLDIQNHLTGDKVFELVTPTRYYVCTSAAAARLSLSLCSTPRVTHPLTRSLCAVRCEQVRNGPLRKFYNKKKLGTTGKKYFFFCMWQRSLSRACL